MQDRGGVDDRLVGESEGTLEGSRRRWKDNVKLVFEETCEGGGLYLSGAFNQNFVAIECEIFMNI